MSGSNIKALAFQRRAAQREYLTPALCRSDMKPRNVNKKKFTRFKGTSDISMATFSLVFVGCATKTFLKRQQLRFTNAFPFAFWDTCASHGVYLLGSSEFGAAPLNLSLSFSAERRAGVLIGEG